MNESKKNQLPGEVYGVISALIQFLEKAEDKYLDKSTDKITMTVN